MGNLFGSKFTLHKVRVQDHLTWHLGTHVYGHAQAHQVPCIG